MEILAMDMRQLATVAVERLASQDPELYAAMDAEQRRQETTLELIASENHVSPAVLAAAGSVLTNKYAEGYPGARYYGGCEFHDRVENLARDRAKQLFNCQFVNVQAHSGAQANSAVFFALMEPGDTFASLVLSDGGHLSHGMKINFSGKYFKPVHYPLIYDRSKPNHEQIDYDAMRRICLEAKPKMILCGYSAYPRVIDFAFFRKVADECGALVMADIAHIAGLVAAGVHPSPFPHAHIVTTTTHKTLRGPRGGMIMTNDSALAARIDKAVFPGLQGGPLMHIIAAKAACFGEALTPAFKVYAQQIVRNAQALAQALASKGYRLVSGGTDNHLMLVDLRGRDENLTGADAEKWLEAAGIITNKNGIPQDPRPPKITSGIRLGAPALTTRGLRESDMAAVADLIDRVLLSKGDPATAAQVRQDVGALCARFPMPH
jgi:glycine hydroxymethyltransferase